MKYIQTVATGICAGWLAAVAPCGAQDAPSSPPQVRVETKVVEAPRFRIAVQVPDIAFDVAQEGRLDSNLQIQAAPAASDLAQLEAQTRAYTLGQVYQNLNAMLSPEMAKKTRDIALLRRILALKLTARDIERTLPLLKEMKEADKVVPVKPEQAMDEEYEALLRAKPGDPMPPSSSSALHDAAGNFRTRKQAIWEKMAQEIGKEKADGIRGMLRSTQSSVWSTFPPGQFFSRPSVTNQRNGSTITRPRIRVAPAAPASPATPPSDNAPPEPQVQPAAPPDAAAEAGADARRQSRNARRAENNAQRDAPAAARADVIITPGSNSVAVDVNGNRTRLLLGFYGQATLDELIDLFERKLAAMRR